MSFDYLGIGRTGRLAQKGRFMTLPLTAPLLVAMLVAVAPASAATDKYNVTPQEHAACDDDAVKLCSATYPDEDKLLDCMKANRTLLAPVCLSALKAGLAKRHMRM